MSIIGIGRHQVLVVSHQLGKSKTGTPHVSVVFEDDEMDRITWYGYLTPAALESTLKGLEALGWDADAHNGDLSSLHGSDLLVGAKAEIVVEAEEWNGSVQYKVRWVNAPGGGGGGDRMPDTEAKALAAELRRRILSASRPAAVANPGAAKKPAPTPLTEPDDDLPF